MSHQGKHVSVVRPGSVSSSSALNQPNVADFLGQFFGAILTTVAKGLQSESESDDEPSQTNRRQPSGQAGGNAKKPKSNNNKPKEKKQPTEPKIQTTEVAVAKDSVGFVIGKQAKNVKEIAEKTGTKIKCPDRDEKPVFIVAGTRRNVQEARRLIETRAAKATRIKPKKENSNKRNDDSDSSSSSSDDDSKPNKRGNKKQSKPQVSTQVTVPANMVGLVIGAGEANVMAIEKETNTKIQAPKSGEQPVFTVCGSKPCVDHARARIEKLIDGAKNGGKTNNKDNSSDDGDDKQKKLAVVEIKVPPNLVGLIIGPKGANIKAIAQATGTQIHSPAKDEEPVFKIENGSRKTRLEARRRIDQVVKAASSKKSSTGGKQDSSSSSDEDDAKRSGGGGAEKQNSQPGEKTIQILIPANAASHFVGETAADIAKATETKIELVSADCPNVFKITGSNKAIKKARRLIDGIANAMAPLDTTSNNNAPAAATAAAGDKSNNNKGGQRPEKLPLPARPPSANNNASNKNSKQKNKDTKQQSGNNNFSIYIQNLDYSATDKNLREHFSSCGKIKWSTIIKDKTTQAPKGSALIEFTEKDAVDKAIRLDGKELLGRKLKISIKERKTSENAAQRGDEQQKSPVVPTQRIKRHVVIDADNVCMAHGRGEFYSARGLELAIQYFEALGHKVLAVVPEEKIRCPPDAQAHRVDGQDILSRLEKAGNIVIVPRKKLVDGSMVKPYADLLTVKYAFEEDGVIISNDNMIDVVEKNPQYKEVIESRRIMFTFALDKFMIIDDPNGRKGAHVNDLLIIEKPILQPPDLITL